MQHSQKATKIGKRRNLDYSVTSNKRQQSKRGHRANVLDKRGFDYSTVAV